MEIRRIVRWIIVVGVMWLLFAVSLSLGPLLLPDDAAGTRNITAGVVFQTLSGYNKELGSFIAPIVQLALVVWILIAAAEKFGLTDQTRDWSGVAALGASNNVQAFIAVAIVGALVIGALAGINRIDVLKDIALVVVGFYFGTRQGRAAIETAVAAGVAAGRQEHTPTPAQAHPAQPQAEESSPAREYERRNPFP